MASKYPSRVGGLSFVASGALFLAKSALEFQAGPPPSHGAAILEWVAQGRLTMMFISESLGFASALMVPAYAALYRALVPSHPQRAIIGCGLAALASPILCCLIVVHGRLVYPVFGIQVHSAEIAELVVAITYGGLHFVALLMAVSTLMLSLALWDRARALAVLGFVTAISDLAAGYPDAIGPWPTLSCGALFAAWFGGVGLWLLGVGRASDSTPS